jgi:hypothetical protein
MELRIVEFMQPIAPAVAIVLLGHVAPALAQDSKAYIGAARHTAENTG